MHYQLIQNTFSIWAAIALVHSLGTPNPNPNENMPSASETHSIKPNFKQALEMQPDCIRLFVHGFSDAFRSQSRMALPNCYTDPQDSIALTRLQEMLVAYPKEARNIARIIRSWTDNRAQCTIKQTAYHEAEDDVRSYLKGSISLREASKGTFEGVCNRISPYTTNCRTSGSSTVCTSGGGGLPSSRMDCRYRDSSSECTFTEN